MRSRTKKKVKLNGNKIILIGFILILIIGVVVGSILANNLKEENYQELYSYLTTFLQSFNSSSMNKIEIFIDSLVKYGKYVCLLFLASLIPMGGILCSAVILSKGISLGFTTAILVKQQGAMGVAISVLSFFPQHIIILPLFIFAAYTAVQLSFDKRHKNITARSARKIKMDLLKKHGIIFAAAFCFIILVSLIETFLTPYLLAFVTK